MKKLMFALIALAVAASPVHAEIYNYSCKALDGKTYPLRVDDSKNVLEWRGKKFDITEKPDCGRMGWHAENNEGSFDFCTATQGYGAIENGGNVKAECTLGKAEHVDGNAVFFSLGDYGKPAPKPNYAEHLPKTDDWDAPPTGTAALEPDSEVHVAGFGLGSVRRFSMTDIMASLAKPSAMIVMAS